MSRTGQIVTDLEPSINSVRGQACFLRTNLPFGEELEAESIWIIEADKCSSCLFLYFLVTAQEVIEGGTFIRDAVNYILRLAMRTTNIIGQKMILTR